MLKNNVLQLLKDKMEGLTSTQRKVADYILKNPTEAAFHTIEQLASLTGVSVASVMRLAYSLGYRGYAEFQRDLQELFRNCVAPPERLEANVQKIGKNKLLVACAEAQIANIQKTVGFLSEEAIEEAFELIASAKRIYVCGVRGSFPAAEYLSEGLNRLGLPCEMLVPDTCHLQAILANITDEELVIAISVPRYASRTMEIVNVAKAKGAKIFAITDGYSSPFAIISDVFFACSYESVSFHNSAIGAMFLVDFLITGMAIKNPEHTKKHLQEMEKVVMMINANVAK